MAKTDDVKKLRDATGISVMQCKQALDEAGGDYDKALLILQKKGSAIAAKKSDRELSAGAVSAYVHSNKEVGSMVLLQSETDFVSKNEEFIALAYDIAMHIAAANPQYVKREDIDEAKLAEIKGLFEKEVAGLPASSKTPARAGHADGRQAGKPDDLKDKILDGKVDAYLKNIVLMEQDFIKDPEKTIRSLIEAATQKFGERIEVGAFTRYSTR